MPPLSILIWLPAACGVLGAILCTLIGRARTEEPSATQPSGADVAQTGASGSAELDARGGAWDIPGVLALIGTLGALGLAIGYIADYSPGTTGLTHVTDVVWISELGIHYKLGVSGLNVFLVGLTTLLFAAASIAANLRTGTPPTPRPRLFWFFFMLAESAVLGAFLAQDLALFVAFFDLMLIPFYFLIGMWGRGTREERIKATIKLVI
jgi:NADH:ubiquinone oxidoreductase subunit 4 (subunit M)